MSKTAVKTVAWDPVTGCSVVSPGCANCHAMRRAGGRMAKNPSYAGLTQPGRDGPEWTGAIRPSDSNALNLPVRQKAPRRFIVNAHGDLFHPDIPDKWIDTVFAVMAMGRQHRFFLSTKHAERMHAYLSEPVVRQRRSDGPPLLVERMEALIDTRWQGQQITWPWAHDKNECWPLRNVCLAVSVEDRAHMERLKWLRRTSAACRALALEPLLEDPGKLDLSDIHWLILGGETGRGARPMHPDWVRSVRNQCLEADVPFRFEGWGDWGGPFGSGPGDHLERDRWKLRSLNNEPLPGNAGLYMLRVGKKRAGRLLDGREHDAMPAICDPSVCLRELAESRALPGRKNVRKKESRG